MRIRPRLYDNLHDTLARAIRQEIARRRLIATDVGRLAGWVSSAQHARLREYIAGDTAAIGHLAAMSVAEALGITIDYNIRISKAPRRDRMAA